jgi:hypothetical protein
MKLAQMLAVPAEGSGMAAVERIRFCTNCATLFPAEPPDTTHPHRERVCQVCGLGVLLSTDPEMLSRDHEPLLVVTSDLTISAASEAALELLDVQWSDVVDKPLLSLLDTPIRGSELADRVNRAAAGAGDMPLVRVQLDGMTYEVRVGRCGDPRAALVVFETRS